MFCSAVRKLPLLLAACLVVTVVSAQSVSETIKKGDANFENYRFSEALANYKEAVASLQNEEVNLRLAECYFRMGDNENAAQYFAKSIDGSAPSNKLHYAMVLSSLERYDDAKIQYFMFQSETSAIDPHDAILKALDNHDVLKKDSAFVDISSLEFNTGKLEFSPVVVGDRMIFVSTEEDVPEASDIKNPTGLYQVALDDEGLTTKATAPFADELNSKYNEGPFVIYDNESKIIFTRNNERRGNTGSGKLNYLALYEARKDNNKWKGIKELSLNNSEYSVGHPALSADGNTLLFVSDMPGGYGGTDLYQSQREDKGWSDPVNLGPKVNSKGNEMFPLILGETIYFASNRLGGLGKNDLYKTNFSKMATSPPQNLGYPINTSSDDFGLSFSSSDLTGYFTSSRKGGAGKDDIYAFSFANRILQVSGIVKDDATGEPIEYAVVSLVDEKGEVVRISTDKNGSYAIPVAMGYDFTLKYQKTDYFDELHTLETTSDQTSMHPIDVSLKQSLDYEGQVLDKNGNGVDGVDVNFKDIATSEEIDTRTDMEGRYSFNVKPNKLYDVTMTKEDQLLSKDVIITGEDAQSISNTESHSSEVEYQGASLSPPAVVVNKPATEDPLDAKAAQTDLMNSMEADIIYFDFDKDVIREEAKPELAKVLAILKNSPSLKIMIGAHTDPKGSNRYNIRLSHRRAESTMNYLAAQGIDMTRMQASALGEKTIYVDCQGDNNCNLTNRRVEFIFKDQLKSPGQINDDDMGKKVYNTLLTKYGDNVADNVDFRVSIGAFKVAVDRSFSNLTDLGELSLFEGKVVTYYYIGKFKTMNEADNVKSQLEDRNIHGAFVVPFIADKPVSMKTAIKGF